MGFYRLTQIRMPLDYTENDIRMWVRRKYHLTSESPYKVVKQSVDARKKQAIKLIFTIDFPAKRSDHPGLKQMKYFEEAGVYKSEEVGKLPKHKPVIVGTGPAGLFAGLILAEAGLEPILIERGLEVEKRQADIEYFFATGSLNEHSNIQFGEGGAGTFSDGKLSTGVKDQYNRIDKIIESFIEAGAPEEIAYMNKPHIGTDYLMKVVKNIRLKIIRLGGQVLFNTQLTGLKIEAGKLKGIVVNETDVMEISHLVLAIGHSARDTFKLLMEENVPMAQKAFAVGLRIEHTQAMIGVSQYGSFYQHKNLPVAEYKLTHRTLAGRGVYSFCMCPGGFVVNAASEKGGVVCNGMSYFSRAEKNANSAILINIQPKDFGGTNILAGVAFQRHWEKNAFILGGATYALPIQRVDEFMTGKERKSFGKVIPNIKGAYQWADLNQAFPSWIIIALKEGLTNFGKKIKGFDQGDAILTGVETRSSSPVKILRDETHMSQVKNLYPCGEGAGYAGGIMSAALDGIKTAEHIIATTVKEI